MIAVFILFLSPTVPIDFSGRYSPRVPAKARGSSYGWRHSDRNTRPKITAAQANTTRLCLAVGLVKRGTTPSGRHSSWGSWPKASHVVGVHFKAYWAAESFTSNSQAAGLVTGSLPLAAPPLVSLKKRIKRAKSGEGTHRKGSSRGLSDSMYEIYDKRGTRGSPPKRDAKQHDNTIFFPNTRSKTRSEN